MKSRIAPFLVAFIVAPLSAQTWQIVDLPQGVCFGGLAFDPTDIDHVVGLAAGASPQQIAESIDGGATWNIFDVPLGVAEFDSAGEIAFQSDGRLFLLGRLNNSAINGQALTLRRSLAGQWAPFGPPAPANNPFSADARELVSSASGMIAVSYSSFDGGPVSAAVVAVTVDDGATWQLTPHFERIDFLELGRLPLGTDLLFYVVTNNQFGTGSTLYRRVVGGDLTPLTSNGLGGVVASGRVAGNELYARPDSTGAFGTLRRSDDGGDSWTDLSAPAFQGSYLRGNVDTDLVVRWRSSGSLDTELSRDGGLTWNPLASGFPSNVRPLAFAPDDSRLFGGITEDRYAFIVIRQGIGAVECTSNVNGSGSVAVLGVQGSSSVADEDLLLWTRDVLPGSFGIFIAGTTADNLPGVGGSFGTLCLGGEIGRVGLPGFSSPVTGEFAFRLDPNMVPTPTGTTMIQPGETWRFQAWFRDRINGVPGSNFSDSVAVTFTP